MQQPNFKLVPINRPPTLEFDLKPGEVVYIGNLHMNIKTGKNLFGWTINGDAYAQVLDRHERDLNLLNARYPQFSSKVVTRLLPIGPWINSEDVLR